MNNDKERRKSLKIVSRMRVHDAFVLLLMAAAVVVVVAAAAFFSHILIYFCNDHKYPRAHVYYHFLCPKRRRTQWRYFLRPHAQTNLLSVRARYMITKTRVCIKPINKLKRIKSTRFISIALWPNTLQHSATVATHIDNTQNTTTTTTTKLTKHNFICEKFQFPRKPTMRYRPTY